jgi:GNAT superfamily N-acetyltransferase
METVSLRLFEATDADWLADQHRDLYALDEGFDPAFRDVVAEILADFIANHDPKVDRGWIADENGTRLGSIFCVRLSEETAKLRMFLLTHDARGKGLGKRMLRTCMDHARACGYARMELWTHESHEAACALYAAHGWQCTISKPVHSFGVDLVEQVWDVTL